MQTKSPMSFDIGDFYLASLVCRNIPAPVIVRGGVDCALRVAAQQRGKPTSVLLAGARGRACEWAWRGFESNEQSGLNA